MKFNKWTMGLAAVGVVSLASAARADEMKLSQVQTALSNTTLSGYVDTSIQWNQGTGNSYGAPVAFQNATKRDGFNLNVIDLALDKPMDESPWAAGYHVELWFGPDANSLATLSNPYLNPTLGNNFPQAPFPGPYYDYGYVGGSDFAIRQAYIALRTPVANTAVDWKLGVFDSPLGYESSSSPLNPQYTRSYGYGLEPTELTGLMGTWKANDMITISAGVANTVGPMINQRAFIQYYNYEEYYNQVRAESSKTYFGAITLTAPESWGWAKGSTLTGGILNGYNPGDSYYGGTQMNLYVGGTMPTPVKGLKVGGSFDYRSLTGTDYGDGDYNYWTWAAAAYASYQYNDKLSFAGRFDHWEASSANYINNCFDSFTLDVNYALWQNVLTRLELRWDHVEHDTYFGGPGPYYENYYGYGYSNDGADQGNYSYHENAYMLALQVVYMF
jgi:hypothetical protein